MEEHDFNSHPSEQYAGLLRTFDVCWDCKACIDVLPTLGQATISDVQRVSMSISTSNQPQTTALAPGEILFNLGFSQKIIQMTSTHV